VIIFGSVRFLSKKVTKPNYFFFEKKTKTEPKPGQTDRFRFGSIFLGQKPVQTGLARFFWFWLGFLGFGSVFFGLARFFRFGSVLARFFVGFGFIKPKLNRTDQFFQKINRFNRFFFSVFFPVFSV
jgi:hypothetical protein